MKQKPHPIGIDGDEVIRKRKPSGPKRSALDTRYEHRLSNGQGLYWTGPSYPAREWPRAGAPDFNKAGQKWASLSRTLQLWSEYNIARAVQKADWPDLVLEVFKVTVEKVEAPDAQPRDISKLVHWYAKRQRYDTALTLAEKLIKDGYDFKYLMEYRGVGDELPSHLTMRVDVVRIHSYSNNAKDGDYVTVAFLEDKDMVFARVALGDRVTRIFNDEADIIYSIEPDPTEP